LKTLAGVQAANIAKWLVGGDEKTCTRLNIYLKILLIENSFIEKTDK
jgi:hypothetical protein